MLGDRLPAPKKHLRPHKYLSTACLHELHAECPAACVYCSVPCRCDCHERDQ